MLRALIGKQFREIFRAYFVSTKSGKGRKKLTTGLMFGGFALLMLGLCAMFGAMAYGMGYMLFPQKMTWLYFSVLGGLSILLGTFGSVFNTYAALYQAKDNELLLAMPISPGKILFSRSVLVYAMSLLYSALIWVPAVLMFAISGYASAADVVIGVVLTFVIAMFVTVLTCILGLGVAWLSSRLRNQSFLVVLLSLLFFGAYFAFVSKLEDLIENFMLYSVRMAEIMRRWFWLIVKMGEGAAGELSGFAVFSGITVLATGICFTCMSLSFTSIVTHTASGKKAKFTMRAMKVTGPRIALFKRELKLFTSSANYMLNCGMGLILLPVGAVIMAVKMPDLDQALYMLTAMAPEVVGFIPLMPVFIVSLVSTMSAISTPSVSLEGKRLWILQTLPVSTKHIILAKLQVHLLLNCVVALPVVFVFCILLQVSPVITILSVLFTALNVCFIGALGLMFGLLRANFNWTAEIQPIKQSLNVLLVPLIGLAVLALYGVGAYFLRELISVTVWLGVCTALSGILCLLLTHWLMTGGVKTFDGFE